jgi:hypothetical protein
MANKKQRLVYIDEDNEKPEIAEPKKVTLDPLPNPEILYLGDNEYEEVGVCAECGVKVYRWRFGANDHRAIGRQLAVYVANGNNAEPPQLYCQVHDPNISHRMASMPYDPNRPISGDAYAKTVGRV